MSQVHMFGVDHHVGEWLTNKVTGTPARVNMPTGAIRTGSAKHDLSPHPTLYRPVDSDTTLKSRKSEFPGGAIPVETRSAAWLFFRNQRLAIRFALSLALTFALAFGLAIRLGSRFDICP